jgi:uncharacterized protein YcbK (DUF882 family)
MIQSDDFTYFVWSEFDCKHTGLNDMDPAFIHKLDDLRHTCGIPFRITSGYRDVTHPAEAKKPAPGMHTKGKAVDIAVNSGAERYLIVQEAIKAGFTGIGIAKSFIHLDTRKSMPVIWTY